VKQPLLVARLALSMAAVLCLVSAPAALGSSRPPSAERAAPAAAPNVRTPAAELRVAMGRLLAEHSFLLMEAMRAKVTGGPDFDAAKTAVDGNSADLARAIGGLYGAPAGAKFDELWRGHVEDLIAYATAVAANDEAGKTQALDRLAQFRKNLADFLAAANPEFSAAAEAEALQLHIDQLAATARSDFSAAYVTQREAYAHMFHMADDLSLGIATQLAPKVPGYKVAASPAVTLRLAMGRLLGEHAIIAMEAMRARVSGAADFDAAIAALEANSRDLQGAVTRIYGAQGGTAFGKMWRDHITMYAGYMDAVASGDTDAQAQRRRQLRDYGKAVGTFMAKANPRLSAKAVEQLVLEHSEGLMDQTDAYAAGDYARTYTIVRQGYAHMFKIGDALAIAIAGQFPDRFPSEQPPTTTLEPAGEPAVPLAPLVLSAVAAFALAIHARRSLRPGR
jgi:hypothetical protein